VGDLPASIVEDKQAELVFLPEALYVFQALVDGGRQHPEPLIAQGLLEFLERRHFFDARRTPGGPEIEHHDFTPEVGKAHRPAFQVGKSDVGDGLPDGWNGRRLATRR